MSDEKDGGWVPKPGDIVWEVPNEFFETDAPDPTADPLDKWGFLRHAIVEMPHGGLGVVSVHLGCWATVAAADGKRVEVPHHARVCPFSPDGYRPTLRAALAEAVRRETLHCQERVELANAAAGWLDRLPPDPTPVPAGVG